MRILVTGGCGFIGTNYIRRLLSHDPDAVVVNLDKLTYAGNPLNLDGAAEEFGARYRFVRGDIADAELLPRVLEEHGVEAVVNFAAETHVDRSIDDPAPFLTTNVLGTQNLLEASRRYGVEQFVHVSTDEVYGSLGPTGSFTEGTPLAPNSPYSASKASSDHLCRAYHMTYGFPVVITRCSNNYGPYQFPEKLIPLMLTKAENDEPLPVYGDGLNVRDWIYVLDHCLGVDLALRKGAPGEIYNFGADCEKTNLEVIRTLLQIVGKPESLITFVADRPGHDRRYAMGYDKARRELGFEPEYDFAEGMRETVAWYQNNRDWLENVRSGSYIDFMNRWYGERK
ncbi:dTDP-glucose 4,6-dehydratase [Desulfohalovibrio reitneri]|uniref:dTDP-glucose 4,6-dehydratase n=1 Tax=Desulfohalovibrio reitneri TaxID=1307759 RepID=UPI0004A70CE9|nr:dTDP-glucose 4,6-dehydratase [Desulfohalovibrio reitneri]